MSDKPSPAEPQFRSAHSLVGDRIAAKDGEVCGKCRGFLFDEDTWTIRYVIADTGGFLSHHEVLISPFVVDQPEFGAYAQHMPTVLSKEWIEASPPLDSDAPVSRQYEEELARHYKYPLYWAGTDLWGFGPYPVAEPPAPEEQRRHEEKMEEISESKLRSTEEITGYRVVSGEEELGKVDDFIVETESWKIRYLIVDTGHWLPGKKVIFAPEWTEEISWAERAVSMPEFTRETVKGAPEYDHHEGINRDFEGRLYDYYGRPYYWTS